MVAMAIDVLLTAYSHAIKTGSYYKRIETSQSGASNVNTPKPNSTAESVTARSNIPTSDPDTNSNLSGQSIGSEREDLPAGQSQFLGSGNNQANSNASERQQNQVTSSAATSPADLYSCVFAQVEEEMTGDGSYLVAIIVEFLRR